MNWLYRMVEDATLHSTRARIARRLLLLASGDVTMLSQSRQDVEVSQDTLAMMIGITRQTLSLELKAMAEKGAIALRYGRIEICSKDVLSSFQE
jgi:CRP-like cAMP-binding protein